MRGFIFQSERVIFFIFFNCDGLADNKERSSSGTALFPYNTLCTLTPAEVSHTKAILITQVDEEHYSFTRTLTRLVDRVRSR
eukprot:1177120-Prorocentrum_minimum.AAC.5